MKTKQVLQLTAAIAAMLLTHSNLNAQWATVDDFLLEDGYAASAGDIAVAPGSGAIIAVGSGKTSANPNHMTAAINISADGGINWTLADVYAEPGWLHSHHRGVATDTLGRAFTAGELFDPVGFDRAWFVRESADGGQTWSTSEILQDVSSCGDIKVAPNGDVYAAGYVVVNGATTWLVRRRAYGDSTFATVDSFASAGAPQARMIAFHPTAGVLVAGFQSSRWTVRRSSSGAPGTFTTVDSFAEGTAAASSEGIAVANSGAIYVVGRAIKTTKVKGKTVNTANWIVRRSLNGGTVWTTVDTFGGVTDGSEITALAPGVDSSGAIFVAGSTPSGWLVRKGTTAPTGVMSWTNSDQYQTAPGRASRPNGLAIDGNDDVYAVGWAHDANGLGHWITRKLTQ